MAGPFTSETYQSGDGNLSEPITVGRLGQPVRIGGGTEWQNIGSGPIEDRPSAALFGVGTWQDGAKTYVSDGVSYTDTTSNYSKLKRWKAALAGVQSGSESASIAFVGDSTSCGTAAVNFTAGNEPLTVEQYVARNLSRAGINVNNATTFGDANLRDLTAGTEAQKLAAFAAYDTRWTFGGANWQLYPFNTAGGHPITSLTGAAPGHFTPVDKFGVALVFDTIKVHYLKNAAYQNFSVGVDGGAALFTTTQAGSTAMATATISTTLATHIVDITPADATSKFVFIVGIECYNSAEKTVFCKNFGANGFNSVQYSDAANAYAYLNALGYYAPDLTIINSIINDMTANTSLAAYKSNLQSVITKAKISGDVILYSGNPQSTATTYTVGKEIAYINVLKELAAENDILLVDTWRNWGSWTEANALSLIVDTGHPNKRGYQDIATIITDAIKR